MLVLSRRVGEKIKIGNDVLVTIIAVTGNQVRIGIDAPPEMTILREELEPFARDERPTLDRGHSRSRVLVHT
ncbi:MAG: carbon storage regulator CsrA [Planctomycetes bacterium]|nr:carbon storage regulator CsrA [Planctomycetota bacterium]